MKRKVYFIYETSEVIDYETIEELKQKASEKSEEIEKIVPNARVTGIECMNGYMTITLR